MIYAEILAGGKGTRMGNTEMPKQFLMLGNKPIFIHTVEQFLMNKRIEKILICCPEQWVSYTKDTLKKYISDTTKVIVVKGGETRNDTILNGCHFIEKNYGIQDDDIILTHDAVRPFLTQRIIDDNIDGTLKYGAVDTVVEAFDTIVHSKDGKIITDIPVRNEMYQGQTPQSFNIKLLMSFFNSLTDDEKNILTDACKALVIKGIDVHLVKGEVSNIKITTQYDLKVANGLVEENK
ncbi:MAG: 2-C-methyl-D-erythritol 4-phosphate cytidylyltransferase [Coprobacillus sp.]|nr:2-C-methyl-D-erythritol 4-phosphate cytidylyltransferase [Coprobacillus sp.]MCI9093598.1 2-C-methyl-D-erythritol 4-phosphate cytidylyltransferase [Coprobacillus sp.]